MHSYQSFGENYMTIANKFITWLNSWCIRIRAEVTGQGSFNDELNDLIILFCTAPVMLNYIVLYWGVDYSVVSSKL